MVVRGELTAEERARWIARMSSGKAAEVTRAIAELRDWAKHHVTEPAVVEIVRGLDERAGDARSTIRDAARDALTTIGWAARHAGVLEALYTQATSASLACATAILTPPAEHSVDTPEGAAMRHLARDEGPTLRALFASRPEWTRAIVARIHQEARQRDVAPSTVAEAVAELATHDDAGVRFAAIDSVAIAGERGACDLRPMLSGLVRALAEKSRIQILPGSGTWETSGIAMSAERALGHAVRWPASHEAAIAALRPLLAGRSAQVASHAAAALAWGSARRDEWSSVAELLAAPKAAVRMGALTGLVPRSFEEPRPVPAELAERIAALRSDPDAKIVKLAAQVVVAAGASPADPRILAAGLRSEHAAERDEALRLLLPLVADPAVVEAITPWLVDGLGTADRFGVLRMLARCEALDERWAPLLAGLVLDGDHPSARVEAKSLLARCATSSEPWHELVASEEP